MSLPSPVAGSVTERHVTTSQTPHFCVSVSGDVIYGRVMVDPVQNLGNSFHCTIEKVFLCAGADGYVPKYSPANAEYGCLADSASLLYRFKIVVSAGAGSGWRRGLLPRPLRRETE